MFAKSLVRCIGAQGAGFWSPTARQARSLGEKGSHMRSVSQARFQQRHAHFKLQQAVNLDNRDRQHSLDGLQRRVRHAALDALNAGRRHEQQQGGPRGHEGIRSTNHNGKAAPHQKHGVAQRREDRMSSAREMLQLGESLRRERKHERRGSFVRHEMRTRSGR